MAEVSPQDLFNRAGQAIANNRAALAAAHKDLNALLPQVTNASARGKINARLWAIERSLGLRDAFFSQSGQDRYLDEHVFHGKRDGVFVEIGGYDGVSGSNCLFFELMRGWSGVLVEPSPTQFTHAQAARRCPCLQVAVADRTGEAEFLDVQEGYTQMSGLTESYAQNLRETVENDPRHKGALIKVPLTTLPEILDGQGIQRADFVSLDVEGGELAILSTFPFDRFDITAWCIENNQESAQIPELMMARGYRRIEAIGVDEIYVKVG